MVSGEAALKVGIIDVGLGNTGSLKGALESLGWDPFLVSRPECLGSITHLLLPGVGSFRLAMGRLQKTGLIAGISDHVRAGRPLLGICLGMQILASWGEEGGGAQGLDLVAGKVSALVPEKNIRVPHVGWNAVHQRATHPVLRGVKSGVDYYFVHGFVFKPEQPDRVLGETEYGCRFASMIGFQNIFGVQFHPEKSQKNGLRILDNFCQWSGRC
jgi:glutamine amidotransferase